MTANQSLKTHRNRYAHIGRKGVTHAQSAYFHGDLACAGYPYVVAALGAIPPNDRYPSTQLAKSPAHQVTFTAALSHFLGTVLFLRAREVYLQARHYEARTMITRLLRSGDPSAIASANDYLMLAESVYGNSSGDYRHPQDEYWLSPEDLADFPKIFARAVIQAPRPRWEDLETQQRRLLSRHRDHAQKAKEAAFRYAYDFVRTRKLPLEAQADYLCEIKLNKSCDDDPPYARPMGSLVDFRPHWARRYIDLIEAKIVRGQLWWDKVLFRAHESSVREKEHAQAKSLRRRPLPGKAYAEWRYSEGGYYGIGPTEHNVLYRAIILSDQRVVRTLRKQGLLLSTRGSMPAMLHAFHDMAGKNWFSYQAALVKEFKNQ